ncbi:MAG: hypothetical protein V7L02_30625 [Nostoc sp.]|uniref:hypothetical protein n=1 Tax=Nostoc sp. TaxID=1180 RepID=UPI002FFB3A2F
MANRSRKLTPKASKLNQPPAGAMKRVAKKPQKKLKRGSWLSSMLAIAILLSSASLIMAFAWISVLFIFNPDQVSWLNKILPAWAQIPLGKHERPQTLKQIQLDLSKKNQIFGKTLPLHQDVKNSFLLPVFQQRANCQSDCKELVELRVYELSVELEFKSQSENYYYLATQLPITGPEESFVIFPSLEEPQDINTPLPLTEVQRFEGGTPSPGVWFNLRGQRQQGTGAIAYGHVVYYNPERTNLIQMLSWTSPNGQLPKWQQVTGDATKELVVDQTVGLEPHLEVYQVKPLKLFLKPIQLEAITLKSPVLKDSAYQNALSIARSGLWTPAFEWLKFIKKQRKGVLPEAAQAQMDLIRLHSQLTKTQAQKIWASPSQEVLADLIDGRWQKALQVFEASPHNAQEIATLLKADENRLWNRIAAALQVNPNRPEVQAWFALILAVQRGEEHANSWLKTQPKITKDNLAYIQGLLAKLNGEGTSQISSTHPSQIVGTVQPITQVTNTEWLQPNSPADLKLTDNQVWYQVEVSAFNDGKRWLNFPFENFNPPKTDAAKFFWKTLGITSDPEIQIVVWLPNGEQKITIAAIKAVQLRGKVLRLLAAGPKISENQNDVLQPKPLALTNAALEWVQPSPITLQELHQQNPQGVKVILSSLWQSLQQSGEVPAGAIPSFEQMQQKLGDWPVQVIDLTNNAQPEIILTISPEAIASLNQPAPEIQGKNTEQRRDRTIILSDNNKVIYTDFTGNYLQKLSAIAKLSGVQSLALLVENAHNYSLRRWSEKNQRFE